MADFGREKVVVVGGGGGGGGGAAGTGFDRKGHFYVLICYTEKYIISI